MTEVSKGEKVKETWVIIYYGTGMSAQEAYFHNEEDALKVWDNWVDDPYKSVSRLERRATIRDRYKR